MRTNAKRVCALAAALVIATGLSATVEAQGTNPLLQRASALTSRVNYFHSDDEGVFGPPEPGYCITMLQANATLNELEAAYNNARSSGNAALALQYLRAGSRLADEIEEEDYLDWKYGPKQTCSPTASTPFGPVIYSGLSFQITGELAVGGNDFDTRISTNLPSHEFGSLGNTPWSAGVDARVRVPLFDKVSLAGGIAYRDTLSGGVSRTYNLDPNPPVGDTILNLNRQATTTLYAGPSMKFPTISALREGIAGLPGSGTFDVTLWAGKNWTEFDGNVFTNENGNHRTTPFSRTASGFSAGFDIDYPLWSSGFDTLWTRMMKPVVRAGIRYDNHGDFTVLHQAQFANYQVQISPQAAWMFVLGFALQFYPDARPQY